MRPNRDGKRRGKWLRLSRADGHYLLEVESRKLELFDPEKCLKVGRHDDVLGVVFEVPTKKGVMDRENQWHRTDRGLIPEGGSIKCRSRRPWRGEEPMNLAKASAHVALELAGMANPPRWLAMALSASGNDTDWGSRQFWEELVNRLRLGVELEIVKDVMSS